MFSASYSSSPTFRSIEAEIDYNKDDHLGIGAFYGYANNPESNTEGLQAEYAVLRPKDELSVGTNLEAGVALSQLIIQPPTQYFDYGSYNPPTEYPSGRSASLGVEFYLHNHVTKYRFEPFVQIARTFASVTTSNASQSSALNSLAMGSDIIFSTPRNNFVVFTIGYLFQQHTQPVLAISMSFVNSIK